MYSDNDDKKVLQTGEFQFTGRLTKTPKFKKIYNKQTEVDEEGLASDSPIYDEKADVQLTVENADGTKTWLYITVFNPTLVDAMRAVGEKGLLISCTCSQSNDRYVDRNGKVKWFNSLIMRQLSFPEMTQELYCALNTAGLQVFTY